MELEFCRKLLSVQAAIEQELTSLISPEVASDHSDGRPLLTPEEVLGNWKILERSFLEVKAVFASSTEINSQAIKALKEEGIATVLVNPNIATIQTSEHFADSVYFLPIDADFAERVIEKERPDGILLSFGGQTALNVGLQLAQSGVLAKHGVEVLGTPVQAIQDTEDRGLFVKRVREVGLSVPVSKVAGSVQEASVQARRKMVEPRAKASRFGMVFRECP